MTKATETPRRSAYGFRTTSLRAAYWPLFFCLVLFTGCASSGATTSPLAPSNTIEPWSINATQPTLEDDSPGESGSTNSLFEFAYDVYRSYITPIDGPRCEHTPSCSAYSMQAMRSHGFVAGTWLTIDRLVRGQSSSVLRDLPVDRVEDGKVLYTDPLEENDFFL